MSDKLKIALDLVMKEGVSITTASRACLVPYHKLYGIVSRLRYESAGLPSSRVENQLEELKMEVAVLKATVKVLSEQISGEGWGI